MQTGVSLHKNLWMMSTPFWDLLPLERWSLTFVLYLLAI